MLLQSSIKLFYAAKKVFGKGLDKSALALPSLNFMPTCSKVTKDQISQRRIAALRLPPLAILRGNRDVIHLMRLFPLLLSNV